MSVTLLPVEQRPVLTVREAAAVLGVSDDLIRAMCGDGRLPGAIRVGREWRVPKRAIPGWSDHDWGAEAEAGLRALSEGEGR